MILIQQNVKNVVFQQFSQDMILNTCIIKNIHFYKQISIFGYKGQGDIQTVLTYQF